MAGGNRSGRCRAHISARAGHFRISTAASFSREDEGMGIKMSFADLFFGSLGVWLIVVGASGSKVTMVSLLAFMGGLLLLAALSDPKEPRP